MKIEELFKGDKKFFIKHGDCLQFLKKLPDQSVDLVITDPPYFLHSLDNSWDDKRIKNSKGKAGTIGGLPVGMKFDPKQGIAFQKFFEEVSKEIKRVLVPGGFYISFSQPRLFHRMAIGAENMGFEIRDMLVWHFTKKAQFKAFSQDHFIDRMKISAKEKEMMKYELMGRKTAQLRPQFEALMLAQKPKEGTHVKNWLKWRTGLIDATKSLKGGNSPSTVMPVDKAIRDSYNTHPYVKPVQLLVHLIEVFSTPGQVVLDPFIGSGSTALASMQTGRRCIGIEKERKYIDITYQRIDDLKKKRRIYNSYLNSKLFMNFCFKDKLELKEKTLEAKEELEMSNLKSKILNEN